MNNVTTGMFFITVGLLILFHDYYAGSSKEQDEQNGNDLNVTDKIMGFFMLGLGGYYIFKNPG